MDLAKPSMSRIGRAAASSERRRRTSHFESHFDNLTLPTRRRVARALPESKEWLEGVIGLSSHANDDGDD